MDEGEGFDPKKIKNPLKTADEERKKYINELWDRENTRRSGGLGLPMVREMCSELTCFRDLVKPHDKKNNKSYWVVKAEIPVSQ